MVVKKYTRIELMDNIILLKLILLLIGLPMLLKDVKVIVNINEQRKASPKGEAKYIVCESRME